MDERILVEAYFYFNEDTQDFDVALSVINIGTIDVKIVQIWIIDEDNNDHKQMDVSHTIIVGSFAELSGSEIGELTSKLTNPLDVYSTIYYFKAVTARGNTSTSRLIPEAAMITSDPIVIIPGASYVEKQGNKGKIHLEVWSRLTGEFEIGAVIATGIEAGATKIESIEAEWILLPLEISVEDFTGNDPQIYKTGELVKIELVSASGIVVTSYYFTVA
jgi:hypothetical protein